MVFEAPTGQHERRFHYPSIRRARRVRGSPDPDRWRKDEGGTVETAFYFTQPPPLRPRSRATSPQARRMRDANPSGPFSAIRRTPAKRQVRDERAATCDRCRSAQKRARSTRG